MTTTRKPDLAKVRAAQKEITKFNKWVNDVLLPQMDGKVKYSDSSGWGDKTYHHSEYTSRNIRITETGLRISFISPKYGHNETDTYIGTVTLTWAEINKIAPTPRKAVKR